ncbi:MAG: methyltransferase domain-containing protein [Acidimicrobiales bacterium]
MEPRSQPPVAAHVDLHRADAYGQSFADVYDRWYHDVSDAEATARFVFQRCGSLPIVELGVGSGRLARPLVALGATVIGLDASAPMLEQARNWPAPQPSGSAEAQPELGLGSQQQPTPGSLSLIQGDMRALPVRHGVGGALIAFNTLFNLSSEAEQLTLLHQLRAMLATDGVLIVEALDLSALLSGPSDSIGVRTATDDGVVVSATQLDGQQQTVCGQHLEIDSNGVSIRPWRLRWLTPSQLDAMAAGAGMTLLERFGGWDEEPFTDQSDTHVSVYGPSGVSD